MAYQSIQQEYMQIPPVTRTYTSFCLLTSALVVWRLVTNFMFFGTVSFNLLFNMLFTYRYCRMLEEGSFRERTADFAFMFIIGGVAMTILGHIFKFAFLGHALTIMLVYVWSRRNPYVRLNFFGLINFQAPYLPWVILGFSLLLGNSISVDLMGIAVGHVYYFLEDVYPLQQGGFKLLVTPRFLLVSFRAIECLSLKVYLLDYRAPAEDRNGQEGYVWSDTPNPGPDAAAAPGAPVNDDDNPPAAPEQDLHRD